MQNDFDLFLENAIFKNVTIVNVDSWVYFYAN